MKDKRIDLWSFYNDVNDAFLQCSTVEEVEALKQKLISVIETQALSTTGFIASGLMPALQK